MTMNIEPLENRIAPATLLPGGKGITFTDVDGDLVTIKVSKGVLVDPNVSVDDFTFVSRGVAGGQQLQLIDFSNDGDSFDGATLSITAAPQGGKGDGLVNIGRINATGHFLGAVTVDGDLGVIDAGNTSLSAFALQALTVHSLGALGTTTGAPDLQSDLVGSVKAITVKADVGAALVSITGSTTVGGVTKYSSLGALTIGGSLFGGSADTTGSILVDGDIGAVKVGGSVIGGTGVATGRIGSGHGSIASVTIGGDLLGGTKGFSGYIYATQNLGAVTVGGDVHGFGTAGGDGNNGFIFAGNSMGNVKIGGSLIGGAVQYSGAVACSTGPGTGAMGSVTIGGDVTGGSASFTGYVFAGGGIGAVKIGQDLKGGTAAYSGSVHSAYGNIASASVRGSVLGGTADYTGSIVASTLDSTGTIGAVVIGGDVLGGSVAAASRSGLISGVGGIASVSIGHALKGGASNDSGLVIASNGSLGAVKIGSDLVGGTVARSGSLAAGVNIGAVTIGGSLLGGTADFTGAIRADYEQDSGGTLGAVSIHGDVIGGSSAAGSATGYIFADRGIASVNIGGSLIGTASNSSGSINTGRFDAGDVKVGAITIGGSVLGGSGFNSGGIYTYQSNNEYFGAIKVGGDWKGSSGPSSGRIEGGHVASITIGGSFVGGSGSFAGYWNQSTCGAVKIGRDLDGAKLFMGSVKSITLGGSLIGGTGAQTGTILCGLVGSVVIAHDIRGGSNSGSSNLDQTGYLYAGTLGSVTIGGSITAGQKLGSGQLTHSGAIGGGTLGSLTVKGSLVGNSGAFVSISASDSIKSLTIGGRVEFSLVQAGLDSDGNQSNADAQIGAVKVAGDWIASSITAGVNATDARIGDGNDTRLANASTDVANVFSKIASITIGGQVRGNASDVSKTYGFGAEQIGAFKVNGIAFPLHAGASNDKFNTAGAAGNALPVGASPGSFVNDGFAVHVFEV